MTLQPTEGQAKLFVQLASFSADTILELISNAYKIFGPNILNSERLQPILIAVAETYFNECMQLIQNRRDNFINERFDMMCSVQLNGPSHPQDMLQIIVMLSLSCINELKLTLTGDYESSMLGARKCIADILARQSDRAVGLVGCTEDHIHNNFAPGEKAFEFTLQ
jgi:hypothetical protein